MKNFKIFFVLLLSISSQLAYSQEEQNVEIKLYNPTDANYTQGEVFVPYEGQPYLLMRSAVVDELESSDNPVEFFNCKEGEGCQFLASYTAREVALSQYYQNNPSKVKWFLDNGEYAMGITLAVPTLAITFGTCYTLPAVCNNTFGLIAVFLASGAGVIWTANEIAELDMQKHEHKVFEFGNEAVEGVFGEFYESFEKSVSSIENSEGVETFTYTGLIRVPVLEALDGIMTYDHNINVWRNANPDLWQEYLTMSAEQN